MGRNKRKPVTDGTGQDSGTDSAPVSKKSKTPPDLSGRKATKGEKVGKKVNSTSTKAKMQNIYTDSSTSSESESEKNSVKNDKKSEKSESDSNSNSDSDSDSDSSGSDSSLVSKLEINENVKKNVSGSVTNNIVNYRSVKSYDPPPKSSGSDSYHSDTEEEDKKRRKKQKELLKMQLNKKSKRTTPRKQDSYMNRREIKGEMDDDLKEEDDVDTTDVRTNTDDGLNWPTEDINELISRMEEQIPEGDTQTFEYRASRLDWDKISFAGYSMEDCLEMWTQMSKRIRRYRILSEMLADARQWAKKPWTNFSRGAKKNKHPDMPTKPLSAYMLYYLEQKDKVISENKGVDLMQVSRIITKMYKNLDEKERQKYAQKAAQEKQNFDEKITEFYKEHPEYEPQPQAKTTTTRDLVKGPKKPCGPFKLFFQHELRNHAVDNTVDRKALEESAREKWKNFSDKKKAEWINMSLEDASRYERELKAYRQKNPNYVVPNYNKSLLSKEERLVMERVSGKPVKPPNSAYSLFSRYMLQSDNDVKSKAPKLRMAEISKKWKEISAAEKCRYEEKVKELQRDYKAKLQSYFQRLTPEQRERELEFVKKLKRKKKERSMKKVLKNKMASAKSKSTAKKGPDFLFYEGEPKPPPVRTYDLFLEKFLASRPSGMSEETRLKSAPEQWEMLSETKKNELKEELAMLKQEYVAEFGKFLKHLSKEEIKEISMRKAMATGDPVNGTLTDSNDESDDKSSSDGSDSEDSESGKSSSSSED